MLETTSWSVFRPCDESSQFLNELPTHKVNRKYVYRSQRLIKEGSKYIGLNHSRHLKKNVNLFYNKSIMKYINKIYKIRICPNKRETDYNKK